MKRIVTNNYIYFCISLIKFYYYNIIFFMNGLSPMEYNGSIIV